MEYKVIQTGLDLGTKFLTAETAYFLGLLTADEREVIGETVYWSAPIRHNPQQVSVEDIEKHYSLVKTMSNVIHKSNMTHLSDFLKKQGVKLKKYNRGKTGIVTLFEELQPNYSIEDFIQDISGPIISSNIDIQRAFIIGVFDGRGSDDASSLIAVDFDNSAVMNILFECLNNFGITPNINAGDEARKREDPDAPPRKSQLRIKRIEYLSRIGYISVKRFKISFSHLQKKKSYANRFKPYELVKPLPGLKVIKDLEETEQKLL
ncbi:hypothetical protein CHH85_16495 [Bacillus subtilis]|uniref:hypothetical protein n=1 Tax=Bacillus subtilis TaxID=1423 RepID=UPI0006696A7A|nr:hypothetical protein [Bacillus subtilis]PAC84660.1 hypothetical protein CHI03_15620 [Bacillus subtilis]PAE66841.1 hypothetical protein CHH85_16495 [Bacillus subtilis]